MKRKQAIATWVVIGFLAFFSSGCGALITTALSAGIAYGIAQATK